MKRHFVTFYSPGTFVSEETTKSIKKWGVDIAVKMSKKIKERYEALPYGFVFTTRERKVSDLDSKEIKRSNMYFLGGTILTLEDVLQRNDEKDKILILNMKANNYNKVVENTNSYKIVVPLQAKDIVLKIKGGTGK